MLGIPDNVLPHVRRFGFSGVIAVALVVVMVFGINPITVLTGQVAEPLPYTPLTALEAIAAGDAGPADMAEAVARETDGFWARGFRNGASYYPPATFKMVSESRDLGCGLAGSDIGTFYCPEDSTIYVDMSAYEALLADFPAQGHLAESYLIGLAYGHHVQNAQKLLEERARQSATLSPAALSVLEQRMGAQAACYAGASTKWAGLDKMFGDPVTAAAIAAAMAGAGDVTRAPAPAAFALPRDFAAASPAFTKQWFDAGYAIPSIGTCRLDKIGAPD